MDQQNLSKRTCSSCEGLEEPLGKERISKYLNSLPGWVLMNEETLLVREYKMKNFMAAVSFINKIAQIAEEEGHHPDLHLTKYKHLRVDLSTHAIGGLSENDFILAAKIDQISGET